MIEIQNLTVRFENKLILEEVSCNIIKGKITSIIGKSGIGKSVLMKSVLGLIKNIEGEIYVDNISIMTRDKRENKKVKAKMAMLFQNSALFDSFDVYQNIAFPLSEHTKMSYSEIKEKVKEMIRLVNLPDILELYPSDLSGGMRKRVALARAIIQEPEYLIYDEPTTGLDPITAKEIINLIESIHKKLEMTSIVITHDKDCIEQLTEQIIMIDNKKIIFSDEFKKFKEFEHPTAREFFGIV
ncbi:MAG: ATP-binding cassette domain-containing protein [Candidatus Cloacimonetes bacterium]|nr:ATP-binding cassette domain-containing protein [Candidatus Cloacimonadota bacterium]